MLYCIDPTLDRAFFLTVSPLSLSPDMFSISIYFCGAPSLDIPFLKGTFVVFLPFVYKRKHTRDFYLGAIRSCLALAQGCKKNAKTHCIYLIAKTILYHKLLNWDLQAFLPPPLTLFSALLIPVPSVLSRLADFPIREPNALTDGSLLFLFERASPTIHGNIVACKAKATINGLISRGNKYIISDQLLFWFRSFNSLSIS